MMYNVKKVYTCFSTDVIHEGHLNIIAEAAKYGEVTVGVLSDKAKVRWDRFPVISFQERFDMIKNLDCVSDVVLQDTVRYDGILDKLKPDFVIHGDNWNVYPQSVLRDNVIANLSRWGGKLIEVPCTRNKAVAKIDSISREKLAMPEFRRKRFRKLLDLCDIVKTIEVHSGISGIIAEKTMVERDGELDQFDAMWVSSLCDSTMRGKPDIELVDISSRIRTLEDIMEVTTKPIIFDGDTGGLSEHFVYNVRTLERMGISAVIIEDKKGLKKNSLFGTEAQQTQDSVEEFCNKIIAGKDALRTDEFMIIARIESLILEHGMDDALHRAYAYVKAGADGIMIHSAKETPDEVMAFCDAFRSKDKVTPLVVVPTSYSSVTEDELISHGVSIVIYANHLMRSAFPAMQRTAVEILRNRRAQEAEPNIMPFRDIIKLIDVL